MSHTKGDDFEAELVVASVDKSTSGVAVITLVDPSGADLPAWEDSRDARKYMGQR